MPWVAIPYGDPRIPNLISNIEIEAIPIIPLLKANSTIAKDDVRNLISQNNISCFNQLIELSK